MQGRNNGSDLNVSDFPEQPPSAGLDEIENLKINCEALEVTEIPDFRAKAVASLSQPGSKSDFTYRTGIKLRAVDHTKQCINLCFEVLLVL